jgi:tRNA dimethylallyltransferase
MTKAAPAARHAPPVVVVTGPTAAGKTEIAVALALRFDAEIVNADSMQVYRYMDIGTSKPGPALRARVPHHLLDVVTPDVVYSAGRFAREAREAAAAIHARGRAVLLVGGTGLYIRAFLAGLIDAAEPDAERRRALEQEQARAAAQGSPQRLHQRLSELDPESARAIHPHDVRRTVRALELAEGGSPASLRRRRHGFGDRPFRVLHLALDPGVAALDARIDARCAAMIEAGLLREVRELRERGYGPELRSMQAIGYRHLQPVVEGAETLANAQAVLRRDTRRFARRQRTWLRRVEGVVWLDPGEPDAIAKRVEAFLDDGGATRGS